MAVMLIRPEVIRPRPENLKAKPMTAGIWIFDLFGSCDLDLYPMAFIDELDL